MTQTASIYALYADMPLTKRYGANGIESYPNAYAFTSEMHTVRSTKDLFKAVKDVAAGGGCLIKGELMRDLQQESRAGTTDSVAETSWVCFDIDKSSRYRDPEQFMAAVGLGDVSYVVQYSSSHGIERGGKPYDTRLSCHIFCLLDAPCSAPMLKQYLYRMNFDTPELAADLTLTNSACALHYPLDVTTCQNDKLLYVAAPELSGTWKDKMGAKRIAHVAKAKDTVTLSSLGTPPSAENNKSLVAAKVNALRKEAGMEPRKKYETKYFEDVEVLSKPDQATVSGIKEDRGFVYLNINGGNSWGYFHPTTNFEVLYNFKGEPNYLTKELLPDYYAKCSADRRKARASADAEAAAGQGTYYLAFRDFQTGAYYNGTWDGANLTLAIAKGKEQLRDFLAQHGKEMGDHVPDWEVFFDPTDPTRVDVRGRRINLCEPSDITSSPGEYPTITRVLQHVLNDTEHVYNHFINWLAFIIQHKRGTGTAWVFQGTQGTGKGITFEHILSPLLGYKQTTIKLMDELESQYNEWMQHTQLVMVDEVQIGKLSKARTTSAKLKSWITEPWVSISAKYCNTKAVASYINWVFASNQPDPVYVEEGDRRHNVGNYQSTKLAITQAEVEGIADELPAFLHMLERYPVDMQAVRMPIKTAAREQLIELTRPAVDVALRAIMNGDLSWLISQLPYDETLVPTVQRFKLDNYRSVLSDWEEDAKNKVRCVSRDQLQVVMQYVVGDVPETPNKFTSYLKHHRAHVEKVWYRGKAMSGIKLNNAWKPHKEDKE